MVAVWGEQDVVLLQEMWVAEDRQAVCRLAAKGGLLYAHHYAAGVLGGGLMLLSRHPILEARTCLTTH